MVLVFCSSYRVCQRTSSALLSPLATIFCLRLLVLAARVGRSALDSLTSREADRLAVGVLPRDAREADAMSALVGGVGEAREVLLSMAGGFSVTARSSNRKERLPKVPA